MFQGRFASQGGGHGTRPHERSRGLDRPPDANTAQAHQRPRAPWRASPAVLHGLFWGLRTGAPGVERPRHSPPDPPGHRRCPPWPRAAVMDRCLEVLAKDGEPRGKITRDACCGDGRFRAANKGGAGVGKTQRGTGGKIMAMAERWGLSLSLCPARATPPEPPCVGPLITSDLSEARPSRLLGDKADARDPWEEACREVGVEGMAPPRSNRPPPRPQDGRPLRRDQRRWKIERLVAGRQHYRRLVTRSEPSAAHFLAVLRLAAFSMLAKKYL